MKCPRGNILYSMLIINGNLHIKIRINYHTLMFIFNELITFNQDLHIDKHINMVDYSFA